MRSKTLILEPGKWYADCRGGEFTSFLKFEGHTGPHGNGWFFFSEMRGFPSSYPKWPPDDFYAFRSENPDWFVPSKEDIEKWDLH